MMRRPNGTGSISRRSDGAYLVRATDPITGKRHKRIIRSELGESPDQHRHRSESTLFDLRTAIAAGALNNPTVSQYAAEHYLPDCKRRVTDRTYRGYVYELESYVLPFVGDIRLRHLTEIDVLSMDRALAQQLVESGHGQRARIGLSLATRTGAVVQLSMLLRHAVTSGFLRRSVVMTIFRCSTCGRLVLRTPASSGRRCTTSGCSGTIEKSAQQSRAVGS